MESPAEINVLIFDAQDHACVRSFPRHVFDACARIPAVVISGVGRVEPTNKNPGRSMRALSAAPMGGALVLPNTLTAFAFEQSNKFFTSQNGTDQLQPFIAHAAPLGRVAFHLSDLLSSKQLH